MTMTVSPPVRIAALVGLAAALGLAGMFMMMGRKSASSSAPPVTIKHHPFGPGAQAAAKPKSGSAPAAKTRAATHATTPATKPVAKKSTATKTQAPQVTVHPKPHPRPAIDVAALNAGLPVQVARALATHRVVVVSLTDPQSEVDGIAFAEARAGAQLAGAAFVPLSVLSQADVAKLTEKFGQVLPDPGLLVYTRPATLAVRLDGFVDKETVAQAAQNAAGGS
jgi:hypothetical protein